MKRRTLLKAAPLLGAAGIVGCAASQTGSIAGSGMDGRGQSAATPPIGVASVRSMDAPLAPVQSSMDRVTRTIVGLRPYRRPGPRLEAVRLGEKDVVHNYGHGGGGVSLSWGVAELAADHVKRFGRNSVAVLGAGAIGLCTALELQRRGADVTIYAAEFPPNTTSNVAGAMWHPVSLYDRDAVTPATMAMLHEASQRAFRRYIQYSNDPRYGVYWIRQFSLSERPLSTDEPYVGGDGLYPGLVRNQPGGPFGFRYHDAYYTLMIDPDIYLRALVQDFRSAGGRMVAKTFEADSDLQALAEGSIVNCLGLGAGAVFGDETIIPARGQLSFLLPQTDIEYGYAGSRRGSGLLYMFPRKTGILLGGSVGKGDWDLTVRQDEVRRMVAGHAALAARLPPA